LEKIRKQFDFKEENGMKKVKFGVLGVGRGSSMIKFCETAENAEVVAICDKWEEGLRRKKEELKDDRITYYTEFEKFIRHPGMDAVVLANYATEHAPFAIRAMKNGLHVFSEVLPCQTLAVDAECVREPFAFVSKRADGPLLQLFVGVGVPGLKAGV